MKRREVKSKGEKERYKHLNAEFQRIAKRDKKAFLRDQCKEIEENKRMGKTKDLFKKLEIPRVHQKYFLSVCILSLTLFMKTFVGYIKLILMTK